MIPKFRAWLKDIKKMVDVTGIDFVTFGGHIYHTDNFQTSHFSKTILMQSTRVKDKNGKEIFEGDIVKFRLWFTNNILLGKVVWLQNYSAWMIAYRIENKTKEIYLTGVVMSDLEVIGNIYENPELLEVEE